MSLSDTELVANDAVFELHNDDDEYDESDGEQDFLSTTEHLKSNDDNQNALSKNNVLFENNGIRKRT